MARFAPLDNRQFLADSVEKWLRSDLPIGYSRMTALVMELVINSRTTSDTPIFDHLIKSEKMHDGDPQIIFEALEERYPDFWEGFPHRGDLTLTKKTRFLGSWSRSYIRRGMAAYGKPNARRTKSKTA